MLELLAGLAGLGIGLTIGTTAVYWFVAKVSSTTIDKIAMSVQYPGAQTYPVPEQTPQDVEQAFTDLMADNGLAPVPDWMEGED